LLGLVLPLQGDGKGLGKRLFSDTNNTLLELSTAHSLWWLLTGICVMHRLMLSDTLVILGSRYLPDTLVLAWSGIPDMLLA